jgi:uncharacterized iron-regulated membrane protein
MNRARLSLRKYHIWLGWIIGLPLLAWTVSGLVMVARPIEHVRGENLIGEPPRLATGTRPVPPPIGPRPVTSLKLEQRHDGPKWVVSYADGGSRLADGLTGRLLPPLTAADARSLVEARYTGDARIKAVDRTTADNPPLELRRKIDAWRVTMDDDSRFYVNAATGEIAARRTSWWRIYDFMWGLHIMDLKTREDTSNPLVIGFGIVALLTTLMAIILLPMTIRRRGRQ